MDAAQFAEFWRAQGHKVIQTESCYWYNPQPFFFMSMPYHRLVTLSHRELGTVLFSGPAIAVRFPAVLDGIGKEGGLFVCSDRNYDFHALQPRTRTATRRGLENCTIEPVDFAYLAEHGHSLNVETFIRQGRAAQTITEQQWRRYCKAASEIPDFEAWGALVHGHLAAFMVTALVEDYFSIFHQSSAAAYLECYPNNALVFTVTKLKLSHPEVGYVSYGLKSLEDASDLDRFKFHMGFRLKPFKEGIVFNPLLKPFLSFGGRRVIEWIAQRHPDSDLWRKASGALRPAMGNPSV